MLNDSQKDIGEVQVNGQNITALISYVMFIVAGKRVKHFLSASTVVKSSRSNYFHWLVSLKAFWWLIHIIIHLKHFLILKSLHFALWQQTEQVCSVVSLFCSARWSCFRHWNAVLTVGRRRKEQAINAATWIKWKKVKKPVFVPTKAI